MLTEKSITGCRTNVSYLIVIIGNSGGFDTACESLLNRSKFLTDSLPNGQPSTRFCWRFVDFCYHSTHRCWWCNRLAVIWYHWHSIISKIYNKIARNIGICESDLLIFARICMTMTLRDETINQYECDKDRNGNLCFKNKNYEISKMGDITLSYGLVKYMTIAEKHWIYYCWIHRLLIKKWWLHTIVDKIKTTHHHIWSKIHHQELLLYQNQTHCLRNHSDLLCLKIKIDNRINIG